MREKAVAISAGSHFLVLALAFYAGQYRPQSRSYPRTITATFVEKLPQKYAGAVAPQPAPPKTEPKPAVVKPEAVPSKKIEAPRKPPEKANPEKKASIAAPVKPSSSSEPVASANNSTSAAAGKATASAPAGSGIARIDAPEFPFPHYLALLQVRIENQWRPPFSGQGQFFATVHFVIAKSGKVVSAELEKSSGNFAFDQAALRAVHNADPLPALPEGSGLETLGVHFDFVANW